MKYYILTLSLMLSYGVTAQYLSFKDFTPSWIHYVEGTDCPITLQSYDEYPLFRPLRSFIRQHDDQLIIPSNIYRFYGTNILSLDIHTGEQRYQVTDYINDLGKRHVIDNPIIVGDTLIVPTILEDSENDYFYEWYKGYPGIAKYDITTGDLLDTVITAVQDTTLDLIHTAEHNKYSIINGSRGAQLYYHEGRLDYIEYARRYLQNKTSYLDYGKTSLLPDGQKQGVDSLSVFYSVGVSKAQIINIDNDSFAVLTMYQTGRDSLDRFIQDFRLDKVSRNLEHLGTYDMNAFCDHLCVPRYYDNDHAIYLTGSIDSVKKYRYVHVYADSIELESTEFIPSSGYTIAIPYQGNRMLIATATNQREAPYKARAHFYVTDGNGNLSHLRDMEMVRDETEYLLLNRAISLDNGDFLFRMDYRKHRGAHELDFGPFRQHWMYVTAEDLGLESSSSEDLTAQDPVLYPIPAMTTVYIDHTEHIDKLELYDSKGQFIRRYPVEHSIDISYLPTGIYILSISYTDGSVLSKKLVKK